MNSSLIKKIDAINYKNVKAISYCSDNVELQKQKINVKYNHEIDYVCFPFLCVLADWRIGWLATFFFFLKKEKKTTLLCKNAKEKWDGKKVSVQAESS